MTLNINFCTVTNFLLGVAGLRTRVNKSSFSLVVLFLGEPAEMWKLVLVSALVAYCAWGAAAANTTLSFAYITSRTGTFVTEGAIPVVDLALELINGRADILSNYTLTYHRTVGNSNVRTLSVRIHYISLSFAVHSHRSTERILR